VLAIKRGLGQADIASVGGVWYRAFVSGLGLVVVALSVTGIVLWMRKREARTKRRFMPGHAGQPV
jgi:uncharacterized iron-regulated membrane protein